MKDERPNPSWSAEEMAAYMREKYGENRFADERTGRPVSWEELCKAWGKKEKS